MSLDRRLSGWLLLGIGGALAELVLLKLLYEGLQWPLPIASVIAAEALILTKFAMADRWVFRHRRPKFDRLVRYHGACVGALVVYWLVFNALALVPGLPYEIAFLVGTGASFAWSLVTNFLWVWSQPGAWRRIRALKSPLSPRTGRGLG